MQSFFGCVWLLFWQKSCNVLILLMTLTQPPGIISVMRNANYWISSFLFTTQHTFRTCCYLTLKENGTDVVLFTVPQFSTPPPRMRDKRDGRFTDPHCKWKWEVAAHWATAFKRGTWRRGGWWKMHHRIMEIINGYILREFQTFHCPNSNFLPYMLKM